MKKIKTCCECGCEINGICKKYKSKDICQECFDILTQKSKAQHINKKKSLKWRD